MQRKPTKVFQAERKMTKQMESYEDELHYKLDWLVSEIKKCGNSLEQQVGTLKYDIISNKVVT